ncbi:MAG: hypothetical protein ACK2UA_16910, partial [Anaerolineae bacterium]
MPPLLRGDPLDERPADRSAENDVARQVPPFQAGAVCAVYERRAWGCQVWARIEGKGVPDYMIRQERDACQDQ